MIDQTHLESTNLPSYDLVIVGYGMVGSIAAFLAVKKKLKVAVIEHKKIEDLYVIKSARIDLEVYRLFDSLGLLNNKNIFNPIDGAQIVDKQEKVLFELDFISHKGFSAMYSFSQEDFQKEIHQNKFGKVNQYLDIFDDHGFEAFEQKEDRTRIILKDNKDGNSLEISSRFLVACNGMNSIIPAQCNLEYSSYENTYYSYNIETETEHLVQMSNRTKTIVDKDFSLTYFYQNEQIQRWEYNIEAEKIVDSDFSKQFNEDFKEKLGNSFKINRIFYNVYDIKVLDEWQRKRIFIAGDAAHVMPPFLGLSLSAGIKDVKSLIWKIALVADRKLDGKVLDYYQIERASSVRFLIYANLAFQRIFSSNWLKITKYIISLIPKVFLKRKINIGTKINDGLLGIGKLKGISVPPFYFKTFSEPNISIDKLLEDNFTIISLNNNPVDLLSPKEIEYLAVISASFVHVVDSRKGMNSDTRVTKKWLDNSGSFTQWCKKNRINHLILRPDQVIFDVCKDVISLKKSLKKLETLMPLRGSVNKITL